MSKEEIRKQLYKLIAEISDEATLRLLKEKIQELIKYTVEERNPNEHNEDSAEYAIQGRTGASEEEYFDDDLTEEQLRELDEAIKEIDRGETITYEEFKKNMDEWRTKLKSAQDSI